VLTGGDATRLYAMRKRVQSVPTHGLTHVALGVRDVERAFAFYEHVFGMVAVYRGADFLQAQTPGTRDVLVFETAKTKVGTSGGIAHFGFRLVDPKGIQAAVRAIEEAGGTIDQQGDFVPGEPYLFARDLDGYLFEVWFELPTKADPPVTKKRS
jgi:catechol 2,3-dioxygenase-like lactoylglutathione lyase family enzyme